MPTLPLSKRLKVLATLHTYLSSHAASLISAKERARIENAWFTEEFITLALQAINTHFLSPSSLDKVISLYQLDRTTQSKNIGIITAGNIPLVSFQDFLCAFLCGYCMVIKPSSKDTVLLKHLIWFLQDKEPSLLHEITFTNHTIPNADAYLTMGTGTNSLYFKKYFEKYPHLIRANKSSVAILDASLGEEVYEKLADDIFLYFGLGCRNVQKLFIPKGFDFDKLFRGLKRYEYLSTHKAYQNNYDYQLTLLLLNQQAYLSDVHFLLTEQKDSLQAPIACIYFQYYNDLHELNTLLPSEQIQCIIGTHHIPFGTSQQPRITDFPDGKDVFHFLKNL